MKWVTKSLIISVGLSAPLRLTNGTYQIQFKLLQTPSGRMISNVEPSSNLLETSMLPLCQSTIFLT